MYAVCPAGHAAAVYQTARDGKRIVGLRLHCPKCDVDMPASPERITLAPAPIAPSPSLLGAW